MGEMREFWCNVYPPKVMRLYPPTELGSRLIADDEASVGRYACVHARLKPEGAPKRYASERERWGWEFHPDLARSLARSGVKFGA